MKNLGKIARGIRPSTAIAALALFIVIGGTATAASGLINGKKIKKGTVTAKQIKNKTITTAKLAPATVASLKGNAGPAGPAGSKGQTGTTGPAGLPGTDGIVSPLVAQAATNVNLPNDTQTVLAELDLPAGEYMLDAKAMLISQGVSTSNYINCAIWVDEQSAVDAAGQSPLEQNDLITLSMVGVSEVATVAELRCNSDSGPAQASNIKLIATPVQG